MTDFSDAPPVADLSTALEPDIGTAPSGGGTPALSEVVEPKSLRDTITSVVKEEDAKADVKPEAKAEPKPQPEAKEKPRDTTGKFATNEKPTAPAEKELPASDQSPKEPEAEAGQEKTAQDRPSEGRKYPEPPARFLPKAKEVWRNTPHAVQQEVERIVREHETETQALRQSHERYETIREYDEIARSNGGDLKQSLAKVVEIENAMTANPIAGLQRILNEVGPRKADGQPLSLYEVATHIVQGGPQAYQQMMGQAQRQQPHQPQVDPRVQTLEQELNALKSQMTAKDIIEPFAREHPRYSELQEDIAFFLQSGKIPTSLSPAERLEAAYDMAERINPSSHGTADPLPDPEPDARAASSFNGTKSIKSAPGAVSSDMEPERGGSIRDLLEDELRRSKRS